MNRIRRFNKSFYGALSPSLSGELCYYRDAEQVVKKERDGYEVRIGRLNEERTRLITNLRDLNYFVLDKNTLLEGEKQKVLVQTLTIKKLKILLAILGFLNLFMLPLLIPH